MIPVRTKNSNFVYRGPEPGIGDAWVERQPSRRCVYLEWQLEEQEKAELLEMIKEGKMPIIRLGIYNMEPIPPVSMGLLGDESKIVTNEEPPKGDLRNVFERPEFSGVSVKGEEGGINYP